MNTDFFVGVLDSYLENIKSLRIFIMSVEKIFREQRIAKIKQNKNDIALYILLINKKNPDFYKLTDHQIEILNNIKRDNIDFRIENNELVGFDFQNENDLLEFIESVDGYELTRKQMQLLYENSLITTIIYLESLETKLIQEFLVKYPEKIGIKKKSLTFEQITKLGSLEDARKFLIEKEVHDIMHDSFKDRQEFYEQKLNLNIEKIINDKKLMNGLVEAHYRRNLLVHNEGRVNSLYVTNVDNSLLGNTVINSKLSVSKKYLNNSIDIAERYGVLITIALWRKIDKNNNLERVNFLHELSMSHLHKENWKLAEVYNQAILSEDGLSETDQLVAQLNYWQSIKWAGNFDSIQSSVLNEDYSAKSKQYHLGLLALQDKVEDFFKMLPKYCPSEIMSIDDLENWPIFREIRKNEFYKEFIEKIDVVTK